MTGLEIAGLEIAGLEIAGLEIAVPETGLETGLETGRSRLTCGKVTIMRTSSAFQSAER